MLIKEKLGRLQDLDAAGKTLDRLPVEWFESNKRILHKRTKSGREITLRFLTGSPNLQEDDVLFVGEDFMVVVEILPCEAIVVEPSNMETMAALCYEIGNKHLPLYYEDGRLLVPFDKPLFNWLTAAGHAPLKERRKLMKALNTTVSAHAHSGGTGLFTKILKLTAPND